MLASKILVGSIHFIEKFMNFHDFLTFFIFFLALFTFVYFYYLNSKMNSGIKEVTKEIGGLTGTPSEKMSKLNDIITTKKNLIIKELWHKYYETLVNHSQEGASIDITAFFNRQTLIDIPTKRKIAEIMPGTLIATGILGTFIGLVTGLSAMDLSSTKAIQASMEPFLAGIKVGFLASVLAIGSSLFWNVFDRMLLHRIAKSVSDFQVAFDQVFPEESLGSYLIEMIKLQNAQNVAVEQMSVNSNSETSKPVAPIETDVFSKLSNSISTSISRDITPLAESLSALANNLSGARENRSSEDGKIGNGYSNVGSDDRFNDSLNIFLKYQVQSNKNIEELVHIFEKISENQLLVRQNVEELKQTMQETIGSALGSGMSSVNDNFIETITTVTEKLQSQISDTFDDEMKKVTLHIDETVNNIDETLADTAKKFNEVNDSLKLLDNKLGEKVIYGAKLKHSDGEFY